MNASQRAKWERTRAIGFWRYALLLALAFSGAMNISISIFDYLNSPAELYRLRFQYLIRALIWLIIGFITAVVIWLYAESKYKKNSGNAS